MRQRLTALCFVVLLAAAPAFALEPYLVKDIDPLPQNQSSNPRDFVSLDNGITVFLADIEYSFIAPELWRSDGTPGGTYKLAETCASGNCDKPVSNMVHAGDRLFYLAATRPDGRRSLWVTGGSAADTFDLGGPFYIDPTNVPVWVKSRGLLFFFGDDSEHGPQLWRSDGTPAGTYRLADFRIGFNTDLVELRGRVYFQGPGGLWSSDGAPRGTKLVKNVDCRFMRSIGSALVFFGPGPGMSLWRSDGTAKGTVKISTIVRDAKDLIYLEWVSLAGRYFFRTQIKGQGEELWGSDGTPAGTRRLTNFANPMAFHLSDPGQAALPFPKVAAGSRLVFAADDGVHGGEPWITDGTPAGTRLLRDICPGACWSGPIPFAAIGSRLIFSAVTTTQGFEPWITDGTPAGTRILRDICPGACGSSFFDLVRLGQGLIFRASYTDDFNQVWKTDGTPRGTTRLTFPAEVSAVYSIGALVPDTILCSARTRADGTELWRTDGTAAGTSLVLDLIDRDDGGSRPRDLFALGSRLLFLADDGLHGRELWASDGTGPGTFLVHDTPPYSGTDYADIFGRVEVGGIAYLTRATSEGYGLWRTDGTSEGTFRLSPDGVPVDGTVQVVGVGNRLFFVGFDEEHGRELWTSDGTVEGTRTLDVEPGPEGSSPERLTRYQGHLYFKMFSPETGEQIWKSDGTPAGTVPVPVLFSPFPFAGLLGEFGGRLWFTSFTNDFGRELWSTDGTETGTRMLGDIRPGNDSFAVNRLLPAGSRMFLQTDNELWVSDGTAAGTRKIGPGPSPYREAPVLVNDRLFFIDSSNELWVSNGSENGTKRLLTADGEPLVEPGSLAALGGRLWFIQGNKIWSTDGTSAGTAPVVSFETWMFTGESLGAAGGRLYFSGWTPQTGHELWAIDPQ